MTKLIALVAAGMFAAGTMFAGSHGDCNDLPQNKGRDGGEVSLASLNLSTPER
jgi:hypothetical protein